MTNEEKSNKIRERIIALGFTPYPFDDPKEYEANPGRVNSPENFKQEEWLSINQCEVIAKKSDRTIYRWQTVGALINFTAEAEGTDRNLVRHYILKQDFLQYMQDTLNQRVIYVQENPMTGAIDAISDKTTDGHFKSVSPDMTIRQPRHEVIDLDPDTKSKMLGLPDELSKRLQDAFTLALNKQKEELAAEYTKVSQLMANQLEYKGAEKKEREELNNVFSRAMIKNSVFNAILIVVAIGTFSVLLLWQQKTARQERVALEQKLSEEYAHKLETSLSSVKQDLASEHNKNITALSDEIKNLNSSVNKVNERLGENTTKRE